MNASAPFSAAEVRATLSVGGMTCGNCVRHVQLPGVVGEAGYEVAVAGAAA